MPSCASKLHPFATFSNTHFCKTTAHLNFLSKFVYLFRLPDFVVNVHMSVLAWYLYPTQRIYLSLVIYPDWYFLQSQTKSQVSPYQFVTVVQHLKWSSLCLILLQFQWKTLTSPTFSATSLPKNKSCKSNKLNDMFWQKTSK